jgi:hypothetical protein
MKMTTNNALGVRTQHPEYNRMAPKWKKIRDVLAAECKKYLRDVGSSETDKDYGKQRQSDYADGAVFFGFTARTLKGLVGSITRKPAEIALPEELEYLLKNCDGAGLGLEQQGQLALNECGGLGRCGLLSDAPNVQAATQADQNAGKLNPTIQFYTAENIINWRKERAGGIDILTQVVLRETYEYQNNLDEFQWLTGHQYRVLEIVDGKYQQRLFKFDEFGAETGDVEVMQPMLGGKPLNRILFEFIGADNNDSEVDEPPMNTLADINIGHYRNSADVEESAFICSQPTLMLYPGENMSPSAFLELNPNGIRLGSRLGHNLGAGGGSELVQAETSNVVRELMKDKEEQAVKAGAQLITPSAQITAEAARLQRGADTSIAATIANNVRSLLS